MYSVGVKKGGFMTRALTHIHIHRGKRRWLLSGDPLHPSKFASACRDD